MAAMMKMTRKRQKKKSGNAKRLSARPKNAEKRNTVKWKKNVKKCDKTFETK